MNSGQDRSAILSNSLITKFSLILKWMMVGVEGNVEEKFAIYTYIHTSVMG